MADLAAAAVSAPGTRALHDTDPRELVVAHVLAPTGFGGAETVVRTLARLQRGRCRRVMVVLLVHDAREPRELLEGLDRDGSEVVRVAGAARSYLRELRSLRELFRRCGVDVVHTHDYRSDVVAGRAGRLAGAAHVATVHGFTGGGIRKRLYRAVQDLALRRADAVLAVSDTLATELTRRRYSLRRLHTLVNAASAPGDVAPHSRAEARRLLGVPADATVIGLVGRLAPEKGPDVALRALARMADRGARLLVIGAGPMREELTVLARELRIEERVHWAGPVLDAWQYLPALDLLALTSHTEGTPIVLLEAAACRIPIVATAVGGVPALLGADAEVVPAAVGEEGIAAALGRVLAAPAAAGARADRLRERLDRDHGAGTWIGRHLELYARVRADSRAIGRDD